MSDANLLDVLYAFHAELAGSATTRLEKLVMTLPYPPVDATRESRLIDDVCVLLHDDTTATRAKVQRWIKQVLLRAQRGRAWWFLNRSAVSTLPAAADVLDLMGSIDRVRSVLAGKVLLSQIPLPDLLRLRQETSEGLNGGDIGYYALEAGHRLHFWPAPAAATRLQVIYTVPMAVDSVPEEWETIILDGVLGLYGRHFDRDSLTQDPGFFEQRFLAALKEANRESADSQTGHPVREVGTQRVADPVSDGIAPLPVIEIGGEGTSLPRLDVINAWTNKQKFNGEIFLYQPAPATQDTSTILLVSQVRNGLLVCNPSADITLGVPTGANLDDSVWDADLALDWSVINTGLAANVVTLSAGAGHTLIGSVEIAGGASGRFRTRKVSAGVFVTYRLM